MRIAVRPCDRSVTVPISAATAGGKHRRPGLRPGRRPGTCPARSRRPPSPSATTPPPAPSGKARPVTVRDRGDQRRAPRRARRRAWTIEPGCDFARATTPTPSTKLPCAPGLPDRLPAARAAQPCMRFPSGSKKWWLTISTGPKRLRSGSETKARVPCRDLPPLTSASADIFAERRRIADGGDVADRVARLVLVELLDDMRAAVERPIVERDQADQLQPVRRDQAFAVHHHRADEGLLLRQHPVEMQVARGGAAVDLGAGDMALLDAQRAQRLQPVGHHAERLAGLDQRFPDMGAVAGAAIDLERHLAGEGEAADHHRRAGDLAMHDAHEGQRRRCRPPCR